MKIFVENFCLHPLIALPGHPVQKYFCVFAGSQIRNQFSNHTSRWGEWEWTISSEGGGGYYIIQAGTSYTNSSDSLRMVKIIFAGDPVNIRHLPYRGTSLRWQLRNRCPRMERSALFDLFMVLDQIESSHYFFFEKKTIFSYA